MNKAQPMRTLMVVQSFNPKKHPFCLKEDKEQVRIPKVPFFNIIGALIHSAKCTRQDIAFPVNLLTIFNSKPTR